MTEQLGKDYLLAEDLKYGVFLVGWSGKLGTRKRSAGRRRRENVLALAQALDEQARRFALRNGGTDVRAVVWDLQRQSRAGVAIEKRMEAATSRLDSVTLSQIAVTL